MDMIENVKAVMLREFEKQREESGDYVELGDGGWAILDGRFNLSAVARAVLEEMRGPTAAGYAVDDPWWLEVDDDALTARSGSRSITVCAYSATIYDTESGKPARKILVENLPTAFTDSEIAMIDAALGKEGDAS